MFRFRRTFVLQARATHVKNVAPVRLSRISSSWYNKTCDVSTTAARPGRRDPEVTPHSKLSPASAQMKLMNWSNVMYKSLRARLRVASRSR